MSKHSSAEDKLHISPSLRSKPKVPRSKLDDSDQAVVPGPPKGTNANNQYR